jgi:site-specific recombinase XerD
MSLLAPTLQAFFTDRLLDQRGSSPNTVAAYRDTFRLLLGFAHDKTNKAPSQLDLADIDAALIGAFLDHLERERGCSASTRNARLAAIRSLFRFAAFRHPEHAELIRRVLAIPNKRYDRSLVSFLTRAETEALLASPDRSNWVGRRDHTLLVLALQTGLRVSELTALHRQDVTLGKGAHIRCRGKGRKERATPLTRQTAAVVTAWLRENTGGPGEPLFPGPRGAPLTRDAVRRIVDRHVVTATKQCPSLGSKNVTPHTLRHSCAMELLGSGVDQSVIALWLGHEQSRTTDIYLHADLRLKERALARTTPPNTKAGRYHPPDSLLAFLEAL